MGEILKKVTEFKTHLERYFERDNAEEKILYVFKKLERLPITLEILQETGIGKLVNSYRKHGNGIGERAREVVANWKQLLNDKPVQPKVTIKSETSHETSYDNSMRIPNMESPPKTRDDQHNTPVQSPVKIKEEPSEGKHHRHKEHKEKSRDNIRPQEIKVKQEPHDDRHKDGKDKSRQESSSGGHESSRSGHRDKHESSSSGHKDKHESSSGGHRDKHGSSSGGHKDKHGSSSGGHRDKHESSSGGHRDKHGSKHERNQTSKSDPKLEKGHKEHRSKSIMDGDDRKSSGFGVDLSVVKNETEEEKRKEKRKDESNKVDLASVKKEKEDKHKDKSNSRKHKEGNVDLSVVKKEKDESKEHRKNSDPSRHSSKHNKHDKGEAALKIKEEKTKTGDTKETSKKTDHAVGCWPVKREDSSPSESEIYPEQQSPSDEENMMNESPRVEREVVNNGLSFEQMLMSIEPRKNKKKKTQAKSTVAAADSLDLREKREESPSSSKHRDQAEKDKKHDSSSHKSKHKDKHQKSSHIDREGESSGRKRKHKDKHRDDPTPEKRLKLDIPPPPAETLTFAPADILSTLPDISPNYKPLPKIDMTSPSRHSAIDEIAKNIGTKSYTRTQVYSGRRTKFLPAVPSLFDSCILTLQENLDSLDFVGGIPYDILKPVVEKATPAQLYNIEDANPQFLGETEDLWEVHCKKDFRNKPKDEFESWRELYIRCHDERERKLKALTAKVSQKMANSLPVRTTKLAYVDISAKPPRGVRRAQIRNGTAGPMNKQDPLARLTSHTDSAPARVPAPPPSTGPPPSWPPPKKAKTIAPMMKKTMRFIKNIPSLRRK